MDQLATLINALPAEQRSYQSYTAKSRTCSFGIPSSATESGQPLLTLPSDCSDFEFAMGEQGLALVRAYAASAFPAQTESLLIGDSSYNPQMGRQDLRPLIEAIKHTPFPKLKQLYLGEYLLFVNGAGATCPLGDVTPILQHAPQLAELSLVGNFSLSQALNFPELTELDIQLDDCHSNINGGPISNDTLAALLSSPMPKLTTLCLDLEIEPAVEYSLPACFFDGHLLPALSRLEIAGQFCQGEVERLAASPLCQRDGFKLFIDD
ncbi:hypothetical protein L9G15_12035 [Shewanella sp. A3A]|nr:hypothetical protein [Shewanella ferrihydritica]